MATNTYVALDKITLGSNASTLSFTGISGSYTDLVLVINAANTSGNQDVYMQFNSDTSTNYSRTVLRGNGSTATSTRTSNATSAYLTSISGTSTTAGEYNSITSIQNYSNATTYKTVLTRSNTAQYGTDAIVNLWRATPAAITRIDITSTGTFSIGSTFTLYGIQAA